MDEFSEALRHYLQGIEDEDVTLLAADFDADQSGTISISEFTHNFARLEEEVANVAPPPPVAAARYRRSAKLSAVAEERPETPDDPLGLLSGEAEEKDEAIYVAPPAPPDSARGGSVRSETGSYRPLQANARTFNERLERYLVNARGVMSQLTSRTERRRLSGGDKGGVALSRSARLNLHRSSQMTALARRHLKKLWVQHGEEGSDALELGAFERVLLELLPPGQAVPLNKREGDVHQLWRMCEDGRREVFEDLLLTVPEERGVEFTEGPFPAGDKGRGIAKKGLDRQFGIEQRMSYPQCRTPVYPPSTWDAEAAVARSGREPSAQLGLRHVFGYRADKQGPNLAVSEAEGLVVYSVAGIAVVQSLRKNTQRFFRGHDDDISCLRLAPNAVNGHDVLHPHVLEDLQSDPAAAGLDADNLTLCVTGQVGARPHVCVWVVLPPRIRGGGGECVELFRMGHKKGQLERMVCAAALSHDCSMVAAIGGDDKHTIMVWAIGRRERPELMVEMPGQQGPPPQVLDLTWAPWLVPPSKAVQNASGGRKGQLAYYLATCGKRHIKFWTLARGPSGHVLMGRNGRYGKFADGAGPKEVLRAVFVPESDDDGICVSAGSNGKIHVWRGTVCIAAIAAHDGPCLSLCLRGCWLYSGGVDGVIKRWEAQGLEHTASFRVPAIAAVGDDGGQGDTSIAPDGSAESSDSAEFQTFARRCAQEARDAKDAELAKRQASVESQTLRNKIQALRRNISGKDATVRPPGVADIAIWGGSKGSAEVIVMGSTRGAVVAIQSGRGGASRSRTLANAHFGQVWGLAWHPIQRGLFATCGHDNRICLWDAEARRPHYARKIPLAAHALDWHPRGNQLACGFRDGYFAVFAYTEGQLAATVARRPCREDIDDLKYSPDGSMLAVASHDQYIDVYMASRGYRHRCRLRGHTSYLTHIDWSADSRILQSNCGAYEILYWNPSSGQQIRSTKDNVEADTDWATWTCVLGFPAMGIWMPDSDGTDVNACHRTRDGGHLVTADDFGTVRLYNAPVVVGHAPHRAYKGHSAHVMNVRFSKDERYVVSVGGNDKGVFLWEMAKPKRK
mmetsp:Transcript_20952/g.63838  ORF Transcript_20952/g.63838 Transcript_20952/m.63838 type:complete len:1077 (-) Transcript_20952:92-3322(-)